MISSTPIKAFAFFMGISVVWASNPGVSQKFLELLKQNKAPTLYKSSNRVYPSSRSYQTDHFTIHYAVSGPHTIPWRPEDNALKTMVNRYYSELYNSNPSSANKVLHQTMENENWDHPWYIKTLATSAEAAWVYYVDVIEMRAPNASSISNIFGRPPINGKYHIEVVDIGEAIPELFGQEIYALTYPPYYGGGILMENDFIYNQRILNNKTYQDTIIANYYGTTPPLKNNYNINLLDGIQVTVVHELYHSIQYMYTPSPKGYHFWYEASAVAMEERLLTTVNDYLQYLPPTIIQHNEKSITYSCSMCINPYGNSVFHTFLTSRLGEDYDKKVWEQLSKNNDIESALSKVFGDLETSIEVLFTEFAKPMIYNQNSLKNPFDNFSPDMAFWPSPEIKNLSYLAGASAALELPPLTYQIFKAQNDVTDPQQQLLTISGGESYSVTSIYNQVPSQSLYLTANDSIVLRPPEDFAQPNYVLIANTSWGKNLTLNIRSIENSRVNPGTGFYPNPFISSKHPNLNFQLPDDLGNEHELKIYSASGDILYSEKISAPLGIKSINLTGEIKSKLATGIYYYQIDHGLPKTLMLYHNVY